MEAKSPVVVVSSAQPREQQESQHQHADSHQADVPLMPTASAVRIPPIEVCAAPSQERTKQPTGLQGGGLGVTASPETRGPGGPAPGVVAAGDGVHRRGPGASAARLPPGLPARPGLIPTSLPGRPAPAPRAGRRGSGGGWSIGRAAPHPGPD